MVTSTGFQSLPSNGTSNAWALYGADALAAVKKLQVCVIVLKQLIAFSVNLLWWMLKARFSHAGPLAKCDKAEEFRRNRTQMGRVLGIYTQSVIELKHDFLSSRTVSSTKDWLGTWGE